jgi:hypothetical protein
MGLGAVSIGGFSGIDCRDFFVCFGKIYFGIQVLMI